LADVQVRRGGALIALGRLNEARQVLDAALPLAEAVPGDDALLRLLNDDAVIYKQQGAFDRCRRCLDRVLAEAATVDSPLDVQWGLAGLGELLFLQGDWEGARAHLERSVDLIRSAGWWLMAGLALLHLARLHLARGDWSTAARYLEDERLQRAAKMRPSLRRLLAERDLAAGQAAAALTHLTAAGDDEDQQPQDAVLLAWAHLELGQDGRAADLLARALARARAEADHLTLVDALRVQALVATRQGRWAEAAQAFDEGLTLARRMPYPYAEARLLHGYGGMHVQKGEPEPARERLEAALAIFRRLGARKDAERAEQTLASLTQV
jgi:tetratricopeptide (TPR) repeat protein